MTNKSLGRSGEDSRPVILFALSAQDKGTFLPNQDIQTGLAADSKWIDVSGMNSEKWQKLLLDIDPEILVTAWDTPSLPEAFTSRADLPLRYVCHMTGGVRTLLPRTLLERGVVVSNWGTTIIYTIAEHALLLTLGALRSLPLWDTMMSLPSGRYTQLRTRSLRGSRVGVHGFGAIAREIIRLLKPFQVEISAYSFGVPKEMFGEYEVQCCDSLEALFSNSDVLIECEALTPHNRGSVTPAVLSLLPQDAVFVNVGRGAVVDEKALVALAKQGRIRLALDVVTQEPLPADSPLFRVPNALLSPHIAGPTWNVLPLCGEFAMANLRRYLAGEPVEGLVTLEAYDRAT